MNDFVSEENRQFNFKIGKHVASALSGFIAGALVVGIIWALIAYFSRIGL